MASIVQSVEYVECAWDSGKTGSVNLTKGQDEAKCIPFFTWTLPTVSLADDFRERCFKVDIYDNAGTAACRVISAGALEADDRTTGVFVVEFVAAIDVQKVAWSMAHTVATTNVAITDVTAQASAFWINTYDFNHSVAVNGFDKATCGSRFNGASTTSVTIDRTGSTGDITGWLYVVDCNSGEFTVDHDAISLAASDQSGTAAISTVLADSFVLADYNSAETGNDPNDGAIVVDLNATTTVRARRGITPVTANATAVVYTQTVECQNGEWTVEHGETAIATATDTATVTAVTQANSAIISGCPMSGIMPLGTSDLKATNNLPQLAILLSFNSSTQIALDSQSRTIETGNIVPWQIVDFTGSAAAASKLAVLKRIRHF